MILIVYTCFKSFTKTFYSIIENTKDKDLKYIFANQDIFQIS